MKRGRRMLAVLAIAGGMLLTLETARGQSVVFVDVDGTGANDGASWCDAFNNPQGALAAAISGDTIRVAAGTYMPDGGYTPVGGSHVAGSGNRTATFQLVSGVTLEGGYAGCGEPDPDERDIELHDTILSGDLNGDDAPDFASNDENSYHVIMASGADETAVLDGFIITAGNADGSPPNDRGAGICGGGGAPTIRNCAITRNRAGNGGAAIHDTDGDITDCTISENVVVFGTGAGLEECDGTIRQCTISANVARWGAGLYNCLATIEDCTITDNSADVAGGGLAFCNGMITRCMVSGNASGNAGGVVFGCDGTIINCVISGNTAAIEGGGLSQCASNVVNSTITGNSNTFGNLGGAVANCTGGFTNCIFWDNTNP